MVVCDWVWYIILKVSKSKYKICYYCMGSTLLFQLVHINVLNYHFFTVTVQRF